MMESPAKPRRLDHLTHKGNLKQTRYGWLRLTPAYSVHFVSGLLDQHARNDGAVLDPFCGTGTTALVCAERGLRCDTADINPFLIWLAEAKTAAYSPEDLQKFTLAADEVDCVLRSSANQTFGVPPLYQIEKWWDEPTLLSLERLMSAIRERAGIQRSAVGDLLRVAFCRTMIERANVSFGHQSMSFKVDGQAGGLGPLFEPLRDPVADLASTWQESVALVARGARTAVRERPRVLMCDARELTTVLQPDSYTCVITSPPYPNRMSYIRELRPYMYWLGYLTDARQAGELDWQAIGGTWGSATSNVGRWVPPDNRIVPYHGFDDVIREISERSPLLSRYVHKYFYDMMEHIHQIFGVVQPGGVVNYIVGNSKFYDVLLPVEKIYAAMFDASGFENVRVEVIRKRTSKKELFEYVVSAYKPRLNGH